MKLNLWVMWIVGIMILLNLAGINTTAGYVLNYLDIVNNPQNFQNTNFYYLIIGIFGAALVGGALVSFFTKSSPESYLVAPLAAVLVLFVGDMISVITYVNSLGVSWVSYIILMIMGPLAVGYAMETISWWRGVD